MKKIILCCSAFIAIVNLYAFTVIIDPGHGGKDTGVRGAYLTNGKEIPVYEKDITLQFSQKLSDTIKKRYPTIQTVLIREEDCFIPLAAREKKIQAFSHDRQSVSLSIHINTALMNKNMHGFTILSQKSSLPFAQYLSEKLNNAIGSQMPNNGVQDTADTPFAAYKATDMVLELGFLSHADDAALLMDDSFTDQAAQCIADSIAAGVKDFYQ